METRHMQAQEFLKLLANAPPKLPFEPSLLPKLYAITADGAQLSMNAIAELVNHCPGLASQVLRLANSAYYGLGSGVSSLPRALSILGVNELRNMVLALGAVAAIKKLPLPETFPLDELLEHQVLTATLAKELTRVCLSREANAGAGATFPSPDTLYSAGLLHDFGKIILASYCPEAWRDINDLAVAGGMLFFLAEDQYWGIDHGVSGSRLLQFWQLPRQLTELVSWHHTPQLADAPDRAAAGVLACANQLAHFFHAQGEAEDTPESIRALLPVPLTNSVLQDIKNRMDAATCNQLVQTLQPA